MGAGEIRPAASVPSVESQFPGSSQQPGVGVSPPALAARIWKVGVVAAMLSGAGAWLGGEAMFEYFRPSEEASSARFEFARLNEELKIATIRNAAVAVGLLGGLLGLALGVTGGLAGRSVRTALICGVVGLVLGVVLGVLPPSAVVPYALEHQDPAGTYLGEAFLIHGLLWTGPTVAAGLAFGLGVGGGRLRPVVMATVGGLIGAWVGTAFFEILGGIAFPLARTTELFSATAETRLIARLAVATGTALGAILIVSASADSEDRTRA